MNVFDRATIVRLTQWTDYTLRVLMYCAACEDRKEAVTITEIAEAYGISRSHLTKVVFAMAGQGWLTTTRGRNGGMRLGQPAANFSLEKVIKATETDFSMVECFDAKTNQCGLTAHCLLKGALLEATQSYLLVLSRYTLADLVPRRSVNDVVRSHKNHKFIPLLPGIPLSVPKHTLNGDGSSMKRSANKRLKELTRN